MNEELNSSGPLHGIIDNDYKKGAIMLLESENMQKLIDLYQEIKVINGLSQKGISTLDGMIEMANTIKKPEKLKHSKKELSPLDIIKKRKRKEKIQKNTTFVKG